MSEPTVTMIVHERNVYPAYDYDWLGVQWPDSDWLFRCPAVGDFASLQPGDAVEVPAARVAALKGLRKP